MLHLFHCLFSFFLFLGVIKKIYYEGYQEQFQQKRAASEDRRQGDFAYFWRDDGRGGPSRIVGGHRDVVLIDNEVTIVRIRPLKVQAAPEIQKIIGDYKGYRLGDIDRRDSINAKPPILQIKNEDQFQDKVIDNGGGMISDWDLKPKKTLKKP